MAGDSCRFRGRAHTKRASAALQEFNSISHIRRRPCCGWGETFKRSGGRLRNIRKMKRNRITGQGREASPILQDLRHFACRPHG
jgi:hypothetical protein